MNFPGGFQTTMVEFIVREALDGVTPGPSLGALLEPKSLPAQPYRFEVDRLGLIDLSFDLPDPDKLVPVTTGWRYLPWMSIDGGSLFLLGASAGVGIFRFPDDVSSYEEVQEVELIGQPLTYARKGYVVPPGATFRLNGIGASPDAPVRVRLGVLLPRSQEEEQAIREAFCCTSTIPTLTEPAPLVCPECDCPIEDLTIVDDEGEPVSTPIEMAPGGLTDWLLLSGPQVNVDSVISVAAQSGAPTNVFVVDAEFLTETCQWRFRIGAVEEINDYQGLLQVRNLCGDTCLTQILDFVDVFA